MRAPTATEQNNKAATAYLSRLIYQLIYHLLLFCRTVSEKECL